MKGQKRVLARVSNLEAKLSGPVEGGQIFFMWSVDKRSKQKQNEQRGRPLNLYGRG